ncbi:MAG: translocation/assembly module TamB domain-containing protein [Gemmatimonadota bacterium]|nr:translocation/assembly module TamB domain-containing protein [Gemmatimonadota bacterium]
MSTGDDQSGRPASPGSGPTDGAAPDESEAVDTEGYSGPERRDPRRRRRARLVGRALGLISLALALALFQFTQTATGRNAAVVLIQGALEDAVNGEIRIGPVLGGNLLTRAVVSSLEILGPDGSTFVALDTVSVEYDPLMMLRREIRVRRLDAAHVEIRLDVDTDGVWNFERIFAGAESAAGPATGDADSAAVAAPSDSTAVADSVEVGPTSNPLRLVMGDATVRDGVLEVRTPWTEGLEGRERELALAEAASSIWYSEENESGELEHVYRVEGLSGRFPLLRLIDPPRPLRVALEEVSGRVLMVAEPLDVEQFSGDATFGDTIRVEIDRLRTVGSSIAGGARLVAGEPLWFDVDLEASPLSFEDIAWLPVPLPDEGGGSMDVSLASRGTTTIIDVSDASVTSGETAIGGGFTLAVTDAPRFESFDVTLDPMRLSWLDEVLGRETVIDGDVTGRLTGSGPIEGMTIDGELTFEDVGGSANPSVLEVSGGVGIVDPFPVRQLGLLLRGFEPRWARALGLDVDLPGRVGGSATIDRPGGGALSFAGDVSHITPEGDVSALSGTGTVDFEGGSVVDLSIEAAPLALAAVRPWLPDLELVGSVSGPIRASGSLASLTVNADLTTPRGLLDVQGVFALDTEEPGYDATLEASDIAVNEWIEGAPRSRLALRGRVTGRGVDPATLTATFDLEVLPSEFDLANVDASVARFHVEEGLARIDTLILRSDVATVSGSGEFGLAADRAGTVEFLVEAADLSELNRWVAEGIPGGAEEDELFASFAAAVAEPAPDESVEGLIGSARATGTVSGTLDDYSIEGAVEADGVRYARWGADSLSARIRVGWPPTMEELDAALTVSGALVDGIPLDSLIVDIERPETGAYITSAYARRDSIVQIEAAGAVTADSLGYRVGLDRARLRLAKLESALVDPATIVYSDSLLLVEGLAVTGALGRVEADGSVGTVGRGDLAVQLTGVRIEQLGYLWSDRPTVGGTLSGSGSIGGTLGGPTLRGTFRVVDPAVGEHRYSSLDARFDYDDRSLGGSVELTRGGRPLARLEGTVLADLGFGQVEERLLPEPLDLRIVADSLPLQLLELRLRGLEQIDGVAVGSFTMTGEPGELRYGGSLSVRSGTAWIPDLGVRLVDVSGAATFRGREARLDEITLASASGGTGRVTGTLDLSSLTDPTLDLELEANDLQAVARRDLQLAVHGTGHLGGRYRAPHLTGQFALEEGDIRQDEFMRERQVLDLSDPAFYRLLDSASVRDRQLLDRFRNDFMDNLVVDAEIDLGPNLWLRSQAMDVEMVADGLEVHLDQARDELIIRGTVELPRGTYRFDRIPPYVQALRITGGTIQFAGTPEFNPNLDIAAEYRNRTTDGPVFITVQIGGTLLNTNLQISSTPPMSETDELCFLAVGSPCVGSGDSQLGQRLLQETLLGTLSSGLSSALVGSTGLSYFNLTSTGTPVGGATQSENLFDMTAVEFGWYASEEVFFTFQQPLRGGLPRATMEWRFTPVWSLEAKVSSRFDDRLFGLDHSGFQDVQTFGLFLYREWAY